MDDDDLLNEARHSKFIGRTQMTTQGHVPQELAKQQIRRTIMKLWINLALEIPS
jgi:hypothetical protein